jgi:hypothetical protein
MLTSAMRLINPAFGYTVPSREEIVAELEKTKYTPDLSRIEEQTYHHVFVCDELKKGHLKHELLGDDKGYAGPGFTQNLYRFWDRRDDPTQSPIPMKALEKENGFVRYFPPPAKIKGEVWIVPSSVLIALDNYKQNTVEFRRIRVPVLLPHRPLVKLKDPYLDPDETRSGYRSTSKLGAERVHVFRPWFYLGKRTFWEPHLTAFDFTHVKLFNSERNWCQKFYHVSKPK